MELIFQFIIFCVVSCFQTEGFYTSPRTSTVSQHNDTSSDDAVSTIKIILLVGCGLAIAVSLSCVIACYVKRKGYDIPCCKKFRKWFTQKRRGDRPFQQLHETNDATQGTSTDAIPHTSQYQRPYIIPNPQYTPSVGQYGNRGPFYIAQPTPGLYNPTPQYQQHILPTTSQLVPYDANYTSSGTVVQGPVVRGYHHHQAQNQQRVLAPTEQLIPNANGGFGLRPVTEPTRSHNAGPRLATVRENSDHNEVTQSHPAVTSLDHYNPDTSQHGVGFQRVMNEDNDLLRDAAESLTVAEEADIHLETLNSSLMDISVRIQVTREDIVENLLNIYTTMDNDDAKCRVDCKFLGEQGLDIGGVSRDVFTTFWQKASPKYFTGNNALVPKLGLQAYDISQFVTLGRIFAHSTAILKAIPIQICRSTLNVIIFGELEMVGEAIDIIIEDFLQYVDTSDKLVLEKALTNYDALDQSEMMDLRNIFASYDMPQIPRKETFKTNLSKIAYNELCIKPKGVCDQMGKGIPQAHRQIFWGHMTIRHIDCLYEVFRPTTTQIIERLRCTRWPLRENSPEHQSFYNLVRFIRSMSQETLLKFLHFVTGERRIPEDVLVIKFTDPTGVSRVPCAHTCSCQLDLPISYTRYEDLEQEFTKVLNAEESFMLNRY